MKRMNKAPVLAVLLCLVMLVTSCDGLFTRTLTPDAVRDPSAAAAALANKSSADLAADAGNVGDMSEAQTVLAALSNKAKNDPDFAANLTTEQKKQILSAATVAVLDIPAIVSSIDINAIAGGDDNGGDDNGNSGDGGDGTDPTAAVIDAVIASVGNAETACVTAILLDATAGGELSAEVAASPEMQRSLAMGAVAVAASTVGGAGATGADLMEAMGSGGSSAEDLLGDGADPAAVEELQTALDTLAILEENGFHLESLLTGAGGDDGSGDGSNN